MQIHEMNDSQIETTLIRGEGEEGADIAEIRDCKLFVPWT